MYSAPVCISRTSRLSAFSGHSQCYNRELDGVVNSTEASLDISVKEDSMDTVDKLNSAEDCTIGKNCDDGNVLSTSDSERKNSPTLTSPGCHENLHIQMMSESNLMTESEHKPSVGDECDYIHRLNFNPPVATSALLLSSEEKKGFSPSCKERQDRHNAHLIESSFEDARNSGKDDQSNV